MYTMKAKYNGYCKVTDQPIVAGKTRIAKVNGKWQVAPTKATPQNATVVMAWSDWGNDYGEDEYAIHYVAFCDDDLEPIGDNWTKFWDADKAMEYAWNLATVHNLEYQTDMME